VICLPERELRPARADAEDRAVLVGKIGHGRG
jgi:hypothetical protein